MNLKNKSRDLLVDRRVWAALEGSQKNPDITPIQCIGSLVLA